MEDVKMPDADQDQFDPDPIKASYDVFIRPGITGDRQVYVLQFPNRDGTQHYSQENDAQPFHLRIKPLSSMVEIDVPIDVWRNYDKEKGIKWGDAVKKSSLGKGQGSHGLPGGFGIGGAQPTGRGRGRPEADEDLNQERILADYASAVQRDQVLKKQTLGGQSVVKEDTNPQYMIGVWRNDQLHLTPADRIVQMRPQFHHIDAQNEQETLLRARDNNTAAPRSIEPRAVHMTVKTAIDGEEDTGENMGEKITLVQQENWTRHRYIDEDSEAAWVTFHDNLFVGEEVVDSQQAKEQALNLSSVFQDEELLDTISVTRDAAKLSRKKAAKAEAAASSREKGKERGKRAAAEGDESDSSATAVSPHGSDDEDDGRA